MCVLSPHLLVAQAVAAALASAGLPAQVRSWEPVVVHGRLAAPGSPAPDLLVLILDGLDTPAVVDGVDRLVRASAVQVVVVTATGTGVRWGGVLASDDVELVPDTASVAELGEVVQRLRAGEPSMAPEVREALRTAWSDTRERRRRVRARLATLSPQQRRVLELLAAGLRVSEVGTEMGVAEGTVRSHVKALRAKLGAPTQLKAVAMYHQAVEAVPGEDGEPDGDGDGDEDAEAGAAAHVPAPRRAPGGQALERR